MIKEEQGLVKVDTIKHKKEKATYNLPQQL